MGKPLPNVDATIFEVKGQLFISDEMLRSFGYLDLDTDSVVLIQNRHFELEGKVHGKHAEGWWIKEVHIEKEYQEWAEDIPTLSAFDYANLQKSRIR